MDNEHCMLLALPCGRDHMDVLQQSNNLQTGFITYLQQKQAAGIVNIAAPGSQQVGIAFTSPVGSPSPPALGNVMTVNLTHSVVPMHIYTISIL